MHADWIIAAFIIIDTILERLEHRRHALARGPGAEILPGARLCGIGTSANRAKATNVCESFLPRGRRPMPRLL